MVKKSVEVNGREDDVFKVVYSQQKRIKELVKRVKEMNEMERKYEVRKEILKQKIVYRLVWEEINRIYFYSEKLQEELSVKKMKKNMEESIEELNDDLKDMGYVYNVYYIERKEDLWEKVNRVNEDDNLSEFIKIGGDFSG